MSFRLFRPLILLISTACVLAPNAQSHPTPPSPAASSPFPPAQAPLTIETPGPFPRNVIPEEPPSYPLLVYSSTSPNGLWISQTNIVLEGQDEFVTLDVLRADRTLTWAVEHTLYIDTRPSIFGFPVPLHWAEDGQYLYFTHRPGGDGCFVPGASSGDGLSRLDLASGLVSSLHEGFASEVAFARSREAVAYIMDWDGPIVLQDLRSASTRLPPDPFEGSRQACRPEAAIDGLLWSPSGDSFIAAFVCATCDGQPWFTSIARISADSLVTKPLVTQNELGLIPFAWPDLNLVILRDWQGHDWLLDPLTGTFTKSND